jgi:hypothetical protein
MFKKFFKKTIKSANNKLSNIDFDKIKNKYYPYNNIEKMNKYINSPEYKKKIKYNSSKIFNKLFGKDLKNKFSNFVSNTKEKGLSKHFNTYKYFPKFNIVYRIKKRILKIFLTILAIMTTYYLLKYFIKSIFKSSSDKQLKEAIDSVNHLKQQNEELKRMQQEALDKLK